ncbi:MAG TPA: hypothetical protein VGB18_06510 [Candidatus Thermoplasmatota archaeon]
MPGPAASVQTVRAPRPAWMATVATAGVIVLTAGIILAFWGQGFVSDKEFGIGLRMLGAAGSCSGLGMILAYVFRVGATRSARKVVYACLGAPTFLLAAAGFVTTLVAFGTGDFSGPIGEMAAGFLSLILLLCLLFALVGGGLVMAAFLPPAPPETEPAEAGQTSRVH